MKKLFIIMTLFMSSFFLFSLEDVKAEEFTVDFDPTYFTDNQEVLDTALLMRDLAEKQVSNSYPYYFIYISASSDKTSVSELRVARLSTIENINYSFSSTTSNLLYSMTTYTQKLSSTGTSLTTTSTYSSTIMYHFNNKIPIYIFYSNFDIPIFDDISIIYNALNFTYVDSVITTNKFTPILDIYNIYLDYNSQDIKHKEELSKVENFYSVVIDKLGYLGETLVNNYIYLSIIVIFILIFVFKLIFRRFL